MTPKADPRYAGHVILQDGSEGTQYVRIRLGRPKRMTLDPITKAVRVVWPATWFRDPQKTPSKRDLHRQEVRERRGFA